MEENVIDTVTVGASVAATDFSIFGLFMEADLVIKTVIVVLLLASFWSWAIIFDKVIRMRQLNAQTTEFEDSFWSGGSLDDLYDRVGNHPVHPMAALFAAAMREWRRSTAKGLRSGEGLRESLQQRIERVMQSAFKDPTAYRVRNALIALRREQSDLIWIEDETTNGEATKQRIDKSEKQQDQKVS